MFVQMSETRKIQRVEEVERVVTRLFPSPLFIQFISPPREDSPNPRIVALGRVFVWNQGGSHVNIEYERELSEFNKLPEKIRQEQRSGKRDEENPLPNLKIKQKQGHQKLKTRSRKALTGEEGPFLVARQA